MLDYSGPRRRDDKPRSALSFGVGFLCSCGVVLGGSGLAFALSSPTMLTVTGMAIVVGLVYGVVHAGIFGSAKFLGGFAAGLALLVGVAFLALLAICGIR